MAVDVALNTPEVWRSVVGYVQRMRNPESTFENRRTVPSYLDEWGDEVRYDVRGPYTEESAARVQAGRDASARARDFAWQPGDTTVKTYRVVSVEVERSPLAWQVSGVRDQETGKWANAE